MAFAVVVIGLSTVAVVSYAVFDRTTAVELAATVDVISQLADEFAVVDSPASGSAGLGVSSPLRPAATNHVAALSLMDLSTPSRGQDSDARFRVFGFLDTLVGNGFERSG